MRDRPEVPHPTAPGGSLLDSSVREDDAVVVDLQDLLRQSAPEVMRVLGRGAQAVVYACRDAVLQRDLASKELDLRRASPAAIQRFVREARVLARLDHPGVPPLYALGRRDDVLYMHMRWAPGVSLAEVARALATPEARVAALVPRLATAARTMAAAHRRGVVHRDLKPDHLILGDLGEVSVVDWGLARLLDEPESARPEEPTPEVRPGLTALGTRIGTPGYWAPEQAEGRAHEAGPAADLWALGRILQFVLDGVPPDAPLPSRGPPELRSVAARALRVGGTYIDAAAFAEDLEAWRVGATVAAHRYTARERTFRFASRHVREILFAALVVLLTSLLGAAIYADRARARLATELWWRPQWRAWIQRSPAVDPAWTALAGAIANDALEPWQARGMALDLEAQERPRLIERRAISQGASCAGRRLALLRDARGALCFGDGGNTGIQLWRDLQAPPVRVGATDTVSYVSATVASDWQQLLLETGGAVEIWSADGDLRATVPVSDRCSSATLADGASLILDGTTAWARRPDGTVAWQVEEVLELIPFERADEALLLRADDTLMHATREGAVTLPCRLPSRPVSWSVAAPGWLVRGIEASAVELTTLDDCVSTVLSTPFVIQDISLDPARDRLAFSSPSGVVELRDLRTDQRHRLSVPAGAASLIFEDDGTLRVAEAEGTLWRFDTGVTRSQMVDGPVTGLAWSGRALIVNTAGSAWRLDATPPAGAGSAALGAPERVGDQAWPWRDGLVVRRGGQLELVGAAVAGPPASAPADLIAGGVAEDTLYVLGAERIVALALPDLRPIWAVAAPPGARRILPGRGEPLVITREGVSRVGPAGARQIWAGDATGAWELADGRVHVAARGLTTLLPLPGDGDAPPITAGEVLVRDASWTGARLALAGSGGVTLLDASGRTQQAQVRSNRLLRALALSPDDRLLATGDATGLVQLWSLEAADRDVAGLRDWVRGATGLDVAEASVVAWPPTPSPGGAAPQP